MRLSTPTILAILAETTTAYTANSRTFAVNHFYGNGPLLEARVDPIVQPGGPSGHAHTIQGGNAFGITMGNKDALDKSTCTSSLVKNDKSNYWTPKLYFQDPKDGHLEPVELFYMNVYYFFEGTTDVIKAFQPGHRMVIGDVTLRTPPHTSTNVLDLADGTPQPVQWTCPRSNTNEPLYPTNSDGLHGVGIQDPGNKGAGVGFPDKNCDGYASPLRADIHFPSCWNPDEKTGGGLTAYKTNMVYPTHGNCPAGWVHTPHLFYEVYWNTPKFADRWTQGQGKQPFVLANGDPTGYSLHADFISGWDEATLQQIIDHCDAGDSGMDKCPGLIGGLNDPSNSCTIASPIAENIFGSMAKLPGNNPVGQWGVNVAAPPPAVSAPAASAPPAPPAPAASVPPASSAAGGNTPKPITSAAGGVKPTSVAGVTHAASTPAGGVSLTKASPTKAPTTAPAGGSPNTLVTSYVSETTVIWTTVTAPGPAPTSGSAVAAGWSYKGCYSDTRTGERVLSGIKFADIGNHAVTNTKCVAYCDSKGYSLAGTEYGGQCFCDNVLTGSSAVDESKCNMPCEGDGSQTCGGSLTLSVYTKAKSKRSINRHLHQHIRDSS